MESLSIVSSLISQASYDAELQELHLTFKSNGARWIYRGVPQSEVDAFASAASPGRHFLDAIKGSYPERRG